MIVFDTSTLIDFFRGIEKTREFMDEDVTTTIITTTKSSQLSNTEKPGRKSSFSEGFFPKSKY